MPLNPAIKKLFVLMLENRSYDNLLGWSDLRGWEPNGTPAQADGLVGKPMFHNVGRDQTPHPIGPGAPFQLNFDPGHEFSDVLLQLCGANAAGDTGMYTADRYQLPADGTYPKIVTDPNALGFAASLDVHGYDVSSALRCFSPEQLPVINFLAHQFAVCDRWFSSMPGPTWPNRFFALAGTSWGLDSSPDNLRALESELFFDGAKFGTGSDSLLTRLAPEEWLVAYGDKPQAKALKGTDQNGRTWRFIDMQDFFDRLGHRKIEETVKLIFIEPTYDPVGNFRSGNSMHPSGDVRSGEQLIRRVYEAIRGSSYWDECVLLITFDEHGGFFDHVIPTPAVTGVPDPERTAATSLTKHGFRFDRYGFRVPAIIISPCIRQGTIDHGFHDHLSIAKTLAEIARPGARIPLLDCKRFGAARSFSDVLTLSKPRAAGDIPDCPPPLPVPDQLMPARQAATARALLDIT